MKARILSTLAEAESLRAALDAAAGLPKTHGAREYSVAQPGRAYARIRARGVRTEHVVDVVPNETGTRFAVLGDGLGSEEVDLVLWRGQGRGTPRR